MTKHRKSGYNRIPEYAIWVMIKQRCNNPNNKSYPYYGGRGIKIYNEWSDSFDQFYKYIGSRPSISHSIDRINNNGHYEPGNVKWSTRSEQSRNRRDNCLVELDGKLLTYSELSNMCNINQRTLRFRVETKGLSVKEAMALPVRKYNINANT